MEDIEKIVRKGIEEASQQLRKEVWNLAA